MHDKHGPHKFPDDELPAPQTKVESQGPPLLPLPAQHAWFRAPH